MNQALSLRPDTADLIALEGKSRRRSADNRCGHFAAASGLGVGFQPRSSFWPRRRSRPKENECAAVLAILGDQGQCAFSARSAAVGRLLGTSRSAGEQREAKAIGENGPSAAPARGRPRERDQASAPIGRREGPPGRRSGGLRTGSHDPTARAMSAIMTRNAPRAAISTMSRRA